jgi:hypothetical protein
MVLTTSDFLGVREILQAHPSEATTLLAAALDGIQGMVEIRDSGTRLDLSQQNTDAFLVSSTSARAINPLARALADCLSLNEASATTRRLCGWSELDYEQRKATGPAKRRPTEVEVDELARRVSLYAVDAVGRGVTIAPFRRISEAVGVRLYNANHLRRVLGDAAHPWLPLALLDKLATPSTEQRRRR